MDGIEQMLEAAERERDQWKEHAMSTEQNLEGVSSSEEVLSRDLKRATLELEQLREEKERLTIEKVSRGWHGRGGEEWSAVVLE